MEGRECRNIFDLTLCDELLAEVLGRLYDPLDHNNISLVCKRWKRVQRLAKDRLGLDMPSDETCTAAFMSSIPSLLAQHPYIACLSINAKLSMDLELHVTPLVTAVATSCKYLTEFHFTVGPFEAKCVEELARGCPHLQILELLQPLRAPCLPALCNFPHLEELRLRGHHQSVLCRSEDESYGNSTGSTDKLCSLYRASLKIIKLALINVRSCATCDLRWLWQSCKCIQKLKLSNCDVVGDTCRMSSIAQAFPTLEEVKLLTCRRIAGQVLLLLARHTPGLKSLTVHDGADTEGLRAVLQSCRELQLLDLRLPLDLSKEDLISIAQNGRCLRSLRLHSCWMATGADMQSLARTISSSLEELVLIRCRAVFQDPGTLSSIGQSLPNLKSIDLSENDFLADKELIAMLAANCERVRHLRLWKCCHLTDNVLVFIGLKCVCLESIDIRHCEGFTTGAVDYFLANCRQLRILAVEENKLSIKANRLASLKGIALIHTYSNGFFKMKHQR